MSVQDHWNRAIAASVSLRDEVLAVIKPRDQAHEDQLTANAESDHQERLAVLDRHFHHAPSRAEVEAWYRSMSTQARAFIRRLGFG